MNYGANMTLFEGLGANFTVSLFSDLPLLVVLIHGSEPPNEWKSKKLNYF